MSAQTVLHCHRIIFQALRWGVRMLSLSRNAAEAVDPPKPKRYPAQTLTWDRVQKFLEVAQSSAYYPVFLMALLTGFRRSELLGLQLQDVNLDTGVLSVRRSLVQLRTGELMIGPPKSGKSRTVVLPHQAVDCFKRVLNSREIRCPDDLVFCHSDGTPLLPNTVTRNLGRLMAKVGLKGFRLHDLRHTHATLLLSQGVHLKVVSERLGHSSVAITADLYSHVLPDIQGEAAMQLSEKLASQVSLDLQKDRQMQA